MRRTRFAGLTLLEPEESISTDNASFQSRNPDVIDHFLEVGAVLHRHDGHDALADPLAAPSAGVLNTGGSIGADVTIFVAYTLTDSDGGETALSPTVTLTTDPPADPPSTPITATVTYNSGGVMADTWSYAITLADGAGGETLLGPVATVDRIPGPANASVTLDRLTADFGAYGATAWRLYKAQSGGELAFYASGATDRFVDAGQGCSDCGQLPPSVNRTGRTNSLIVSTPAGASAVSASAQSFRVYASQDPTFAADSLMGEYPVASAGRSIVYTTLAALRGRPPGQSTCVRGARQIDAERDLSSLYFRAPVAASGALPDAPAGSGLMGQVRMALDTGRLYAALGSGGARAGGQGWTRIGSGLTRVSVHGASAVDGVEELRFQPQRGQQIDVVRTGGSAHVHIGPPVRAWASATTGVIPTGGSAGFNMALGSGWRLLKVRADRATRVTMYAASAKQLADAGRAIGTPAAGNHGIQAEVTLPANDLDWFMAPAVEGYSDDASAFTPISVVNQGAPGAVTVAFLYVRTE